MEFDKIIRTRKQKIKDKKELKIFGGALSLVSKKNDEYENNLAKILQDQQS